MDLVEDVEILAITFLEIAARRIEQGDEDTESDLDDADDEGDQIQPSHLLQTGHRKDDHGFRIRVRTEIPLKRGNVVSDIAVEYELSSLLASELSEELMLEFVNRVGVMALIPYLRQSVADVTQRVFGSPLTMPMIRAGDLQFGPDNQDADI